MKTLYLVRHAKSSWEKQVTDHDRPLNERGERDCVLVANYTSSAFVKPELILTSTALRAYTTAIAFKNAFQIHANAFQALPELYDFTGNQVLRVIENLDSHLQVVMLFGHNYGFTHLVNKLGNKYLDNLPTSGLVQITFATDNWQNLKKGKTTATLFPKDLR